MWPIPQHHTRDYVSDPVRPGVVRHEVVVPLHPPAVPFATHHPFDDEQVGPGTESSYDDISGSGRSPTTPGEDGVTVTKGGRHRGSADEDKQRDSPGRTDPAGVGSAGRIKIGRASRRNRRG